MSDYDPEVDKLIDTLSRGCFGPLSWCSTAKVPDEKWREWWRELMRRDVDALDAFLKARPQYDFDMSLVAKEREGR